MFNISIRALPIFISEQEECVRVLIENGANLNAEDKYEHTPLYYADLMGNRSHFISNNKLTFQLMFFSIIFTDNGNIARLLIEKGANAIAKTN